MSRNERIKAVAIDAQDTERMLEDFTDEEAGKILKGLLAYANRGEEFETEDRAMRCLFKTIQANIDRNNDKYEERCERNRQIALEREQKKKEAMERKANRKKAKEEDGSEEKHERARTCTNVQDEHERARTTPIEMLSKDNNHNKEPKGSMSKHSFDVVSESRAKRKSETKPAEKELKIDFEKVRQQWNRIMEAKAIPKIRGKLAGQRKRFFEARVREDGIITAYRVMIKAAENNFLNGGGRNGWVANFEWIYRPNNFPKVRDGYYDNSRQQSTPTAQAQGGTANEPTETPTASGRTNNRNEQRATEQRQRIQGYAGIASKWRQAADNDIATMGNTKQPPSDIPR